MQLKPSKNQIKGNESMSIESWRNEFYPIDAAYLVDVLDNEPQPDLDATSIDIKLIEHSLLKWKGALKENLERHESSYSRGVVFHPGDCLVFDSSTCALCQKYTADREQEEDPRCTLKSGIACPIVRMQEYPCDGDEGVRNEEFSTYCDAKDSPEPMIELLEKTLEFVKNERK
jgi:hypothetical protein